MTAPMAAPVSTLVELGELIRSQPGPDAPPQQVAAWYERKAVVLGHIAAETGDADAARCSQLAHAHAASLLTRNALIGGLASQGKAVALPGGEVWSR